MNISLKEMAENAVHFGHVSHKWNPKMKSYLYGKRHGIHIFDLRQTAEHLVAALDFLANAARANKTILFVGTKQQSHDMLHQIKDETQCPIVTDKWIPGLLTNFKTIKKRIDYFKDLKRQDANGELDKYTKKEKTKLQKKIQDLSSTLSGVEDMRETPDVLVVTDIVRDKIAVNEARRLKIPVVGIVDSNADPDTVDYAIPANDDAVKSLTYILTLMKDAIKTKGKDGKKDNKES